MKCGWMDRWQRDREIDSRYKCIGNIGYKQLLLLEYRDEKDLCPARIKESFFEKVELALGRIHRSRKEGEISLGNDLLGSVLVVDLKSKVERAISFTISVFTSFCFLFKLLIDYILCICMCKQSIRAGVLEKFVHWLPTVEGCGVCVFIMNILNMVAFHGYCLVEMAI